jgi:hypothetical protein
MSIDLACKRVLLMAPRFFGYEQDIAAELRRRGAHVEMLPDRPFDTPFMTAVTRFRRKWMIGAADRLYRRLIKGFGRTDYDLFLVVNGQTLSRDLLSELRRTMPGTKFVLYMWDSIENRQSVVDNLDLFDARFSFDPNAVERFGMQLRPLFFVPGFERAPDDKAEFDISFVGTAHTDRYQVVASVERNLPPSIRRYWYLYLQAAWVFTAYKLTNPALRGASKGEFHFDPLTKAAVQDIFFRSRAILDIEHPRQSGLTMRTFETIGASKKLVTTNARIQNYDFFDPQNICVIDRADSRVPADFLESPYRPVAPALYAKYSIAGWLDEILGGISLDGCETPPAPAAASEAR